MEQNTSNKGFVIKRDVDLILEEKFKNSSIIRYQKLWTNIHILQLSHPGHYQFQKKHDHGSTH